MPPSTNQPVFPQRSDSINFRHDFCLLFHCVLGGRMCIMATW